MRNLFISIMLLSVPSVAFVADADEVFLEGFPDVPLLEGVREKQEDRVVFDTLGGTVAQTVLISEKAASTVLARYATALPTFGWQCNHSSQQLQCKREGNGLLFSSQNAGEKAARIILRLEPNK